MLNSPERGLCKRKWAVCKVDGPLVLYANLLEKRLRRHFFPCKWVMIDDELIQFTPVNPLAKFGPDFGEMFRLCIRNINSDLRVQGAHRSGYLLCFDAPHHINAKGILKRTKI